MVENDIKKLLDKGQTYLYPSNSKNKRPSTINIKKALVCFEKVLKLDPKDPDAWYLKGRSLHRLEKYKEAIACFDRCLKLSERSSKDIDVWTHKAFTIDAIVNSKKKSKYTFKDVIFCYDKALDLDRKNPKTWYGMGHAFSRQGSINVWDSIDAIKCWFNTMNLYYANNVDKENTKDTIGYKAAIDVRDTIFSVNQTCGDLISSSTQKQTLRDVIKICDSIQKFAQNINPQTWKNKGVALMNLGKPKEAIACFDKVLKPTDRMRKGWFGSENGSWDLKNYGFVFYSKGLALDSLTKYKEALRCYDKALKIDPKDSDALNSKREILTSLGRTN